MKEITLIIKNMTCVGCAEKITDILNEMEGVIKVKAKALKKSVHVKFVTEKISEDKIKTLLTETGYKPTE